MDVPMKNPLTATSFSRYKVHATCPRQAKYKFIDKLPEPKGPAMERGNTIHKGLESYLLRRVRALPKDASTAYGPRLTALYKSLRQDGAQVELELAVTTKWRLVDWFHPTVWFRAKLDAALLQGTQLHLYDHKTGKERPEEHAEQLETYVAIAPAKWPQATEIIANMAYTDTGSLVPAVFSNLKKTVPALRKKWEKRLAPLLKDRTFRATPGGHCRWCAYSGNKGGPCEAG